MQQQYAFNVLYRNDKRLRVANIVQSKTDISENGYQPSRQNLFPGKIVQSLHSGKNVHTNGITSCIVLRMVGSSDLFNKLPIVVYIKQTSLYERSFRLGMTDSFEQNARRVSAKKMFRKSNVRSYREQSVYDFPLSKIRLLDRYRTGVTKHFATYYSWSKLQQ